MMLNRLLIALSFVWTALALPAYAETQYPTGLRVGLEAPPGLTLSTRFPGFEDAERRATITVLDLPAAAYLQLETLAFSDAQLGLTDVKRETFAYAQGFGLLVTARGEQNGVKFQRWFFVAKPAAGPELDLTAFITVEVPESALDVYTDEVVRKTLASVTFRKAPLDEQLRALPFRLGDMAGFRVVRVIPGGVILTEGPTDDLAAQPYVIVGVGRGSANEASERGRFARDLLTAAPFRDLALTSGEAMRLGRTPGYEIRATAKAPDGKPLSLVQWIRFGSGGYLRIVGVSHAEAWEQMFPRFRTVRDGVDAF